MNEVIEKYREYVMTGFVKAVQPIVIEKASGAVVTSDEGKEYIDCFAGIAVVNAGHCNPEVVQAAKEQLDKLVHCCSYLYHNQPVADLAELMARITPGRLKKSFFANSGAEAIEGAMKLAKLYTGKTEIIALTTSFHGRTWGALSVTGNTGRKRRGGPYASGIAFAPAPFISRSQAASSSRGPRPGSTGTPGHPGGAAPLGTPQSGQPGLGPAPAGVPSSSDEAALGKRFARELEDVLRFHTSGDVAAFIAEPVLGEGGIIIPPGNYLKEIKKILDRHGILFIADEVQSGFGRTGQMFAIEHYGVEPDIIVTAKGIASGFPLGAFTTRDEIASAFQPGDHLSTFGGNPVSCAAAIANINFLQREKIPEKAKGDGDYILAKLEALGTDFPVIGEVRGLGLMIGIELVAEDGTSPSSAHAEAVRSFCFERGLLVGVGGVNGNVVRVQPPLVITREQIDFALDVLEQAFATLAETTTQSRRDQAAAVLAER